MSVLYAPEALDDLEAAVEYIAERNPVAAGELAERVFALVQQLAAGEFEGSEQQLLTGETVRSWPCPPLRVYYQRTDQALHVLRIYHQARRPITK